MMDLLWELMHEPKEFATLAATIEAALSVAALVAGLVAVACVPALAPLGAIVALGGAGGLIFGHW